ncbi:unnamed protein product [Hapterophycus canaliculatus]
MIICRSTCVTSFLPFVPPSVLRLTLYGALSPCRLPNGETLSLQLKSDDVVLLIFNIVKNLTIVDWRGILQSKPLYRPAA